MELNGVKIGFILTGSFSSIKNIIPKIKQLVIKEHATIFPIMSFNCYKLNTRYGKSKDFIKEIEEITGKKIIHTIQKAEFIGRKNLTDIMIISPCSRKYYSKISL